MKLGGKVALVTGSSSGIGKAIALLFAKEGADIAVNARDLSKIEATVDEVKQLGRRSIGVSADVSNSNEVAPNGESFNQMKSRVLKFIKSLENKNYKKVLVVSHEGPVRAILSEYYMINFNSKKCDSPKEAIYEIEVKDGKIKGLKCINH